MLAKKKKEVADTEQRKEQLKKIIQDRKANLEYVKSALLLKEKKKQEKALVVQSQTKLKQLECDINLVRQDITSL